MGRILSFRVWAAISYATDVTWVCGAGQWENLSSLGDGLGLILVMILARDDFRKEIDESYRYVGIVLAFAAPIAIVITILSAFPCCLRWLCV